MPDHSGVVIESQVDWLTASAHGEDRAGRLLDWARSAEKEEKAKGNKPKSWRLMGYIGTHCGAVEWGQRDRGATLVRLIGDRAAESLADVLSLADTVTRVDLATTWRADPPDPTIGERLYSQAAWWHRDFPKSALPSCVRDENGGFTAYLGKRESEYFFRCYNKEAECRALGDYEGLKRYVAAWRFELEVKGSPAIPLSHRVNDTADSAAYIQNYLWTYLDQHGIKPPFPRAAPYR